MMVRSLKSGAMVALICCSVIRNVAAQQLQERSTGPNPGLRAADIRGSAGKSPDLLSAIPAVASWPDGIADVRSFGVKGDGQVADARGIQATIDAVAAAGGGIVVIPPGNYRLETGLVLHPGISLSGIGHDQEHTRSRGATLTKNGPGDAIVFVGDGTQGGSGPVVIQNLKIVGNASSGNGIAVTRGQMVKIRDNHIIGHGGACIRVSGSIGTQITSNRIQACSTGIEIGNDATTVWITENRIEDQRRAAVLVSDSDLVSVVRNLIESNEAKGIHIVNRAVQFVIGENWFENNNRGGGGAEDVFLEGSAYGGVSRGSIMANRLNSLRVTTSLRVEHSSENIVQGNLFGAERIMNVRIGPESNDNLFLWNSLAGSYSDLGVGNVRNEHGRVNELGTRPAVRGDANLSGNVLLDTKAPGTPGIGFVGDPPEGHVAAPRGSVRASAVAGGMFVKSTAGGALGWERLRVVGGGVAKFRDGATMPSVSSSGTNGQAYKTNNTRQTRITDFRDGAEGQQIVVVAGDGNTTIVNGSGIRTATGSDRTLRPGEAREFLRDGDAWLEICGRE